MDGIRPEQVLSTLDEAAELDPELERYNLGDEDLDVLAADGVTVDGDYYVRRYSLWQQPLFTIKSLEDESEFEMGHAAWSWTARWEVDEKAWLEHELIVPRGNVTAVTPGN